MLNKVTKILLFLVLTLFSWGYFLNYVNAAACNSSNLFLSRNAEIGWGDTPINFAWSPVSLIPNSTIRLSVGGEDGCAGREVSFQIKQGGRVIKTISGKLVLGKKITTQTYQLYYDWTSDVPVGAYKFRAMAPSMSLFSADSSNLVNIHENSQPCRLSTVNTTPPNGTTYGTPIKINVTGQGICQDWGVTVNIYETTGGTSTFISPTLAEQKFSAGSNQLIFSWSPIRNPGIGLQASYRADAVIGSQTLSSNGFIVSGVSGGSSANGDIDDDSVDRLTNQGSTFKIFSIPNPFGGQLDTFDKLFSVVLTFLYYLAGPTIVVMIVLAGLFFLFSQGEPSKIQTGKKILLYAVIGFIIILIGGGFVTLLNNILELGT